MSPGRIGDALGRWPVAGIAIPLIVTLTLWRPNMDRLPYEDALPTVGVACGLALLLLVGLRMLLRSWQRAALISAIWAAYILYIPAAAKLVGAHWLIEAAVFLVAALFAWDVSRRVPREREALIRVNGLANLFFVPLAAMIALMTAAQQIGLERARPEQAEVFAGLKGSAGPGSPDVWHIVLDRYANSETLARVYGYDNAPFLAALRARGFAVDERAHANYQRTAHSVASTLNASYLSNLAGRMAHNQRDWVPIYRAMTDNAALRFFDSAGYRTVFAGSWWNPTRRSDRADINVNHRDLPELGRLLLDQSAFGTLLRSAALPFGDARTDQCHRLRYKFARLQKLAREPGRKYVFGHFLAPHPPYVINAGGGCRSLATAEAASRRDNYLGQLRYVNRELIVLVDAIRSGPRPAVILIHADEGPWPEPHVGDERFIGRDPVAVDWAALASPKLREKMGILMAVRYADGAPRGVPASPVNLYPAVLAAHFDGPAPDQADRHLLFVRNDRLYTFSDVTERLR